MPMPRAPHGTQGRYRNHKCRCDACCAAHAVWLDETRDERVARVQAWAKANPEKCKAQMARHRAKYREERRVAALAYYHEQMATNPERVRARRREWFKTPKGVLANRLARHARRGAPTDAEYAEILYRDPCAYCGARPVEVDHVTPVSRGGSGDWTNLTPACRACNAQKNDRPLIHYLLERSAA